MAARHLVCDKTEIIVSIALKNKYKILNLTYEDVVRIQFDEIAERKMVFQKVPSEKITIVTGKHNAPIVYTKMKEKKFWDEYKKGLEKFATSNNITFVDNLK